MAAASDSPVSPSSQLTAASLRRTGEGFDPRPSLVYGRSITGACFDWAETQTPLAELAAAVRSRRNAKSEGKN